MVCGVRAYKGKKSRSNRSFLQDKLVLRFGRGLRRIIFAMRQAFRKQTFPVARA
jgi:hypothetical protein